MTKTDRPNVCEELERLIYATSLLDVLTGLELVCGERAELLRRIDGITTVTRTWERASAACGRAARDL